MTSSLCGNGNVLVNGRLVLLHGNFVMKDSLPASSEYSFYSTCTILILGGMKSLNGSLSDLEQLSPSIIV
jgi:hypothetical protein